MALHPLLSRFLGAATPPPGQSATLAGTASRLMCVHLPLELCGPAWDQQADTPAPDEGAAAEP